MSSNPILSALRRDHARGVKVQVILDQHPYGIKPWMVRREAWAVRETGASLHWAPARFAATDGHYRFDHAKLCGVWSRGGNRHRQFRLVHFS
ncbi:MAG: hypothetical protein M0Z43_09035 [Acidithiobacillus sp.]|nr:hypothetical protein [Acidithiobacillus sp.]